MLLAAATAVVTTCIGSCRCCCCCRCPSWQLSHCRHCLCWRLQKQPLLPLSLSFAWMAAAAAVVAAIHIEGCRCSHCCHCHCSLCWQLQPQPLLPSLLLSVLAAAALPELLSPVLAVAAAAGGVMSQWLVMMVGYPWWPLHYLSHHRKFNENSQKPKLKLQ